MISKQTVASLNVIYRSMGWRGWKLRTGGSKIPSPSDRIEFSDQRHENFLPVCVFVTVDYSTRGADKVH